MNIQGTEYDIILDGSDIIAQGITQDIIFEGGADLLKEQAESACSYFARELNNAEYRRFDRAQWISEYMDEKAENWINKNLHLGKEISHNLN